MTRYLPALFLLACAPAPSVDASNDSSPDAVDASPDNGLEADSSTPDSGIDSGVDSGVALDSGIDTGADSGADTGVDTGTDTGADTGADTGTCPVNSLFCGRGCCPLFAMCDRGTCFCAMGQSVCGTSTPPGIGYCANLSNQSDNCGACGRRCEDFRPRCASGVCVP